MVGTAVVGDTLGCPFVTVGIRVVGLALGDVDGHLVGDHDGLLVGGSVSDDEGV